MKQMNIVFVATGLLVVSLASTSCSHSSQEKAAPGSVTEAATQSVRSAVSASETADEEMQDQATSTLDDAKLYCLGMILYAQKHNNMYPTNLSQTLPYLRAANRVPGGTNHFEILYHGSLDKLPNPMTNGVIILRSEPWQVADGSWVRIYGFADGHCETHSEPDDNFSAWEKRHSLSP